MSTEFFSSLSVVHFGKRVCISAGLFWFVYSADNVHYQHTAQMVRALTEAEIKFRVQVRSASIVDNVDGDNISFHVLIFFCHREFQDFIPETLNFLSNAGEEHNFCSLASKRHY